MKIFTIPEIAIFTRYTQVRIHQIIKEKSIPVQKRGSIYIILEKEFNEFFKNRVKPSHKW